MIEKEDLEQIKNLDHKENAAKWYLYYELKIKELQQSQKRSELIAKQELLIEMFALGENQINMYRRQYLGKRK